MPPALLCLLLPLSAWASTEGVVGENLLWLAIMLMAARLFSPLAERAGFPAVLGELLLGIVFGNLALVGVDYFVPVARDPIIAFIAELGVVILLLQIGLETRLQDLLTVGLRASLVGAVGIVLPFIFGAFLVGPLLLPGKADSAYLFLGATLAATSVGITGRVFRDLGRLQMPEARIVLGAAVIDDVLGLVMLAVVSSLVTSGGVSLIGAATIIARAVAFLAGALLLGRWLAPHSSAWLARLDRGAGMLFAQIVATALFLAWLAHAIGLAPLIGAFAAGLLFEPVFLRTFGPPGIVTEIEALLPADSKSTPATLRTVLDRHTDHQHEHLLEPLGYFFVPVFFVFTGMQVDLRTLADPATVAIALGVTAAAIAGKLLAGLAAGRGVNAWIVGWGMVPRGEVGLIFAMAGKGLGVMSETLFSVIVIMVILTTMITPPVLTRLLRRHPSGG
ncbi:MAG TPA: cation:proton antiporter [Rhodocyclaceae bacterium]|nr:cation:proton antiporter [Rhodocyclaceae bacterium]